MFSLDLARLEPNVGDGALGVDGLAHSLVWPLSKVSLVFSDKVARTTYLDTSLCTQSES